MYRKLFFCLIVWSNIASAQFAPPAGVSGTTAIFKDSSIISFWASGCTVLRGYQNISDPSLGYANAGDSSMALGPAGGNGIVSLGDAGEAILSFSEIIVNGPGWDFAVFENSFSDDFLELAFVEVSSDGINFFRFPATSNIQDTAQVGTFDLTDATLINNLAGKYRGNYGTPFDLEEMSNIAALDVNAISHVRVIDVVGSIDPNFARLDQFGKKINDPWPTAFSSGGFDLDAVGVINSGASGISDAAESYFSIHPNPSSSITNIKLAKSLSFDQFFLSDLSGRIIFSGIITSDNTLVDVINIPSGIYFVSLTGKGLNSIEKLIICHD